MAFKFYDTYGFPIDLTQDIAEEHGMTVDEAGFEAAMEHQRTIARGSQKSNNAWDLAMTVSEQLVHVPATNFVVYEQLSVNTLIQCIIVDVTHV